MSLTLLWREIQLRGRGRRVWWLSLSSPSSWFWPPLVSPSVSVINTTQQQQQQQQQHQQQQPQKVLQNYRKVSQGASLRDKYSIGDDCRHPGVRRGRRQEISGDPPRRRQQLQLARPARVQELTLPGGLAYMRGLRSCCQADRAVKRIFAKLYSARRRPQFGHDFCPKLRGDSLTAL